MPAIVKTISNMQKIVLVSQEKKTVKTKDKLKKLLYSYLKKYFPAICIQNNRTIKSAVKRKFSKPEYSYSYQKYFFKK